MSDVEIYHGQIWPVYLVTASFFSKNSFSNEENMQRRESMQGFVSSAEAANELHWNLTVTILKDSTFQMFFLNLKEFQTQFSKLFKVSCFDDEGESGERNRCHTVNSCSER